MKLIILLAFPIFSMAFASRAGATIGHPAIHLLRADTPAIATAEPITDTVNHRSLILPASLGNIVLIDETVSLTPNKGLTIKLFNSEFSFTSQPRKDQFNEHLKWWGAPP
ncbi:MAG: hypothetical protein ABIQ57_02695, partial [Candidatus Kapaibacterium sp.]